MTERVRDEWRDDKDADDVAVVRSEEELEAVAVERKAGTFRLRKVLDEQPFSDDIQRGVEHADIERIAPMDDDSGEIESLPDGSVSIPVFEEQLVVEKRLVVRERIVIRKRVEQTTEHIDTHLRRELVEIDTDAGVADRVHVEASAVGEPTD